MTVVAGRQYATTLNEIRRDHLERYQFAARLCRGKVVDLGCGIGYGSFILASASADAVLACDKDREAKEFGRQHWHHDKIVWWLSDFEQVVPTGPFDWAIAFEVVEHLADPKPLLTHLQAGRLLCSVPNQDVLPFDRKRHDYHHRHYTRTEFEELLAACGWRVTGWYGQEGKASPVLPNVEGMTLIAMCER